MAWSDWTGWDTAAQIGGSLGVALESAGTFFLETAKTLETQATTSAGRAELMRNLWQQMDTLTESAIRDLNAISPNKVSVTIAESISTMRAELSNADAFLQSAKTNTFVAENLGALGKNLGAIVATAEILYQLNNPNLSTYDFAETGAGFIGGLIGAGIGAVISASAFAPIVVGLGAGVLGKYLWENYVAPKLGWSEKSSPNFWDSIFNVFVGKETFSSETAATATSATIPARRDPLVLDLDGDGIETTSSRDGTVVLFDHDADGVKTGTGWVKPDDGWLVMDRNGNGTIDSGRELFGVDTLKSNGTLAADGFDALKDLDTNRDGLLNASDNAFAKLRIWRDLNQDDISQSNELSTLSSNNIISIGVKASAVSNNLGNGNIQTAAGTFTRSNGTTGSTGETNSEAANLDLLVDTFHREFTDHITLTEQAKALPDLKGSGQVRDLSEAISLSISLGNTVQTYAQQTTRDAQISRLDGFIEQWANTSSMKSLKAQADALADSEVSFTYQTAA